jgi:hypothetical protein
MVAFDIFYVIIIIGGDVYMRKYDYGVKTLKASNLDWTIVRVPFIDISDARREVMVSLLDCKGAKISSASLADFLIGQIEDQKYLRKAPFIWDI